MLLDDLFFFMEGGFRIFEGEKDFFLKITHPVFRYRSTNQRSRTEVGIMGVTGAMNTDVVSIRHGIRDFIDCIHG